VGVHGREGDSTVVVDLCSGTDDEQLGTEALGKEATADPTSDYYGHASDDDDEVLLTPTESYSDHGSYEDSSQSDSTCIARKRKATKRKIIYKGFRNSTVTSTGGRLSKFHKSDTRDHRHVQNPITPIFQRSHSSTRKIVSSSDASSVHSNSSRGSTDDGFVVNGISFTSKNIDELRLLSNDNHLGFDALKCFQYSDDSRDAWVRDDAVSVYFSLLNRTCNNKNYIFKPLWYSSMMERVKQHGSIDDYVTHHLKLTRNSSDDTTMHRSMFEKDNLFIPVISDRHWLVVRVCLLNKVTKITVYDSYLRYNNRNDIRVLTIANNIKNYLTAIEKKRTEFDETLRSGSVTCRGAVRNGLFEIRIERSVVQQSNSSDCGLFMMTNVVCLLIGRPIRMITKKYIEEQRSKYVLESFRRGYLILPGNETPFQCKHFQTEGDNTKRLYRLPKVPHLNGFDCHHAGDTASASYLSRVREEFGTSDDIKFDDPVVIDNSNLHEFGPEWFDVDPENVVLVKEGEPERSEQLPQVSDKESPLDVNRWRLRGILYLIVVAGCSRGQCQAYSMHEAKECHYEMFLHMVLNSIRGTNVSILYFPNGGVSTRCAHATVINDAKYLLPFSKKFDRACILKLLKRYQRPVKGKGKHKRQKRNPADFGVCSE
jgi:hypothetical protein